MSISDEQRDQLLADAKVVEELVKLRAPKHASSWSFDKIGPSVTAIATVLITFLGSYKLASLADERHERQEYRKTVTAERRQTLRNATLLASSMLRALDNRRLFATGHYDNFPEREQDSVRLDANLADAKWNTELQPMDLSILVDFDEAADVIGAWHTSAAAIDSLAVCTDSAYIRAVRTRTTEPPSVCKSLHASAKDAIGQFSKRASTVVAKDFRGDSRAPP